MTYRTIFQSEASDCGIACLAMVYARHNSSASLRQVRDCIGTFARGMTAGDLLLAAEKLGLSARCIRIDIEELSELALPAILHWGMNHFVVLDGIRRGRYVIRDPAEGIRHVSKSELASNFTGVCFEFDPAVRILDVRKRAWGPGKEWLGKLPILPEAARLLSLSILIEVCGLTTPMLIRYVLNSSSGVSDTIFQIILYSGCLVGLLAQALTISYRQQIIDYLRFILNRRMSLAVLRHLLALPVKFFSSRTSADIVSRCHSVDDVYAVYSGALAARLLDVVVAAISVSIMIAFSWKLAIVPIGSAIAYSLIRSFMHKPALEAHAAEIRARTRLDEMLLESVKGVGIIKSYSGIDFRISQLNNKISESLGSQLRTSRLTSLFHLFSSSCFSIDLVISIALGVFFVLKSELTIGDFMAFLFIRQTFMMKYCGAFDGVMAVRALDVHLERVAEITSAHRSTCYLSVLTPANTTVVDGEFANLTVACSDVFFQYEGRSNFLIKDFNYRFLYGLSYALIGPSGCGKSTLAKMLCGLILPTSGNICLESAGFAETEKAIRAVFPEDILFAGSISENVALWASQIDIDAVERALADACLLQDVQSLPMGLDTPVGEGGSLLSAGQRQRLLIARALYCDPKILILDEATSQLDRKTERQILTNLDKRGMTRIHCAHHSQVIECCDHILVSDEFHSFSEISKLTLSQ